MPNRIYNKQVTPKGYRRGGDVMSKPKPKAFIFKLIQGMRHKKQV